MESIGSILSSSFCSPSSSFSLSLLSTSGESRRKSTTTQTVLRYKWKFVPKQQASCFGICAQHIPYHSVVWRKVCGHVSFSGSGSDNKRSLLFYKPSSKMCGFSTKKWFRYRNIDFGSSFTELQKVSHLLCKSEHLISYTSTIRLALGFIIIMSLTAAVNMSPAWSLTEENTLFLEAWKTVDRAYVDKTFNGQSWFRYREKALKSEPMNTRGETYVAIKKMLATLDDPFTRFLEPEKFKSLRSGTQGALTGVGLSIAYPTGSYASSSGLVVMSSTPGGPAYRAGIASGDIILMIGGVNTEEMSVYEAAERLQGPEGSSVQLLFRSGAKDSSVNLLREKVTLNPVKSRFCEISIPGKEALRIGYIKLSTFNQNASGAVRDAIEALQRNNVKSFVLDLRNNSGGLFPEGIEIAKIWLQKGVIVYICDSRGVRDIYEADGNSDVVSSEPLVVLVNKGTASASEILAGALKDNNRAVLYGEPTFGKGKIQSVFELSDGSGIVVTVARYETPAHIDIDKVGIIPDHPLPTSFPLDEDGFCSCLKDPSSACNLNNVNLFSR